MEWPSTRQRTNSSLYSRTQFLRLPLLLLSPTPTSPYCLRHSRTKSRLRKNGARLLGQLQKLVSNETKRKISLSSNFAHLSLVIETDVQGLWRRQGGQSFPRASRGPRHTLVPTVSYSSSDSSKILKTCKQNSSTIASALFALSNLAFIRSTPPEKLNKKFPTNLYSALNVRGFLEKEEGRDEYHIAIGYYKYALSPLISCLFQLTI